MVQCNKAAWLIDWLIDCLNRSWMECCLHCEVEFSPLSWICCLLHVLSYLQEFIPRSDVVYKLLLWLVITNVDDAFRFTRWTLNAPLVSRSPTLTATFSGNEVWLIAEMTDCTARVSVTSCALVLLRRIVIEYIVSSLMESVSLDTRRCILPLEY